MSVNAIPASTIAAPSDPKAAEREQVKHLAQEFEAMFISEMMRGMRESLLSEEEAQGLGSETMTDTFDSEFGRSMSSAGGLGLARIMIEGLNKQLGTTAGASTAPATSGAMAAATTAATAAMSATSATMASATASASLPAANSVAATSAHPPAAVMRSALAAKNPRLLQTFSAPKLVAVPSAPAEDSGASTAVPSAISSPGASPASELSGAASGVQFRALPGQVTSKFGWRADPFTGRAQFHAGTDIRLAYGHDVQSVAAGRVKSVGEQSGYGLTVVIDHGQGLETRYAHLSNASVKAGDVVDSGQVVARSGNSGRSTGPHLHLEARQNGRAVEMAALLKSPGIRADSYADDRTIVRSGHED
jgi:murein DD-endopeptidase MepM/ murein hydrolase activator NlpD